MSCGHFVFFFRRKTTLLYLNHGVLSIFLCDQAPHFVRDLYAQRQFCLCDLSIYGHDIRNQIGPHNLPTVGPPRDGLCYISALKRLHSAHRRKRRTPSLGNPKSYETDLNRGQKHQSTKGKVKRYDRPKAGPRHLPQKTLRSDITSYYTSFQK